MWTIKMGFVVIMVSGLSGCASLTTYNKTLDLENRSVSIDAKQRVIYSRQKVTQSTVTEYDMNNKPIKTYPMEETSRIICAEPSPDALAVLGASGALSGNGANAAGGSASGGISEAAASIGLRTQSIQLLRDLNYRICEAFANDAIGRGEASALLRRGQSTMMGLIAIEQLTGPIVASQVTLSAAVNAGTGGSASDTATEKSAVIAAREALLTAQAEVDAAEIALEKDQLAAIESSAKLSDALSEGSSNQSAIDALKAALNAAQEKEKTSGIKLKDKRRRESSRADELKDAEVRLADAERGRTGSSTMTATQIAEVARANADGTQALAEEVRGIVRDINLSYLRDGCFSLVTDTVQRPQLLSDSKNPELSTALSAALATCTAILNASTQELAIKAKRIQNSVSTSD